MPTPIWLAFAALLGWPLLQLASVFAARPSRSRMRGISDELSRDERYGRDDHELIRRTVQESHGTPVFVTFPILLPIAILAGSIAELIGRDRPSTMTASDRKQVEEALAARSKEAGWRTGAERVDQDDRFRQLTARAFDVSVLRWPLTSLLTILFCLPVLPLYGLAYGLRRMGTILPETASRLAMSLRFTAQGVAGRH